MKSSFRDEDVTLLLKDITGIVEPLPTKEREQRIQKGTHYSEMLPLEYKPTEKYIQIYEETLEVFGQTIADAIAIVSDKIVQKRGESVVIVSLARAGTPIGVLISRYIRAKYGYICPHYSISIIRDRGMDRNAVNYILERHNAASIQFVDGWTGKGVIYKELKKEIQHYDGVSDSLAVVADPAYITDLCGTHDDILIPSSCLNSTVCGLISRTFLRNDVIGENDFHGAAYYGELMAEDRTYEFIDHIESRFSYEPIIEKEETITTEGVTDVDTLSMRYGIDNINYIKPGIGETTRVLLRRVPWKVIISEQYRNTKELEHIKQLALEKDVPIEYTSLKNYKCCGLIKKLSDI
ncbi:cysteine protease StiP family protein [Butyrivibrio sp. AC2005]|uniref:cysteine protease StiP family protein n=1 Tax=Butyrivibrio sp. AC2005 TaxID=1280672 RepID=UPI00040503E4|nr:cysteine protease StiP family protein [Butyrivibrio sp. AC2005]